MKKLITAISLALSLSVCSLSFSQESRTENINTYEHTCNELERKIEFGKWTEEDFDLAQKKTYELATLMGGIRYQGSFSAHSILIRDLGILLLNNGMGTDLTFFDYENDGLQKGSPDFAIVTLRDKKVKYIFNEPGIIYTYNPNIVSLNDEKLFELDKILGSELYQKQTLDSEQWKKDVTNLIGDYQQSIIMDYFMLLRGSNQGIITINSQQFNLL